MTPRALLVCPWPPVPMRSGRAIRMMHLIGGLADSMEIDLVANDRGPIAEADLAPLRALCRRVEIVSSRREPPWRQAPRALGRLLRGQPFETKYFERPEFLDTVRARAASERYAVALVEETATGAALPALRPLHGARTVLLMHDMAHLQFRRMFRTERNPLEKLKLLLTWWPMRTWEPRTAGRFDLVVTVSEHERRILAAVNPAVRALVVPNGVDTHGVQPVPRPPAGRSLLLIGALDYPPNVDAASTLCRAILPRIRARHPDCTCTVVGRAPVAQVRRLADLPGVTVEGDVPDVRPYYAAASVAVVPLRAGGGTRVKILEAMALGVPVVSTTVGREGLEVEDGVHLLVADAPAEFADRVCRLLEQPDLCARLSAAGRRRVEDIYDWGGIAANFNRIILGLCGMALR
jgi:polysaccharide biosynthesis protein PslH